LANTPSKLAGGKVIGQQVLLPDLAAGGRARHDHELGAAVEPDDHVAKIAENYEIASGAAAEIEDAIWRDTRDGSEQRLMFWLTSSSQVLSR
jgi:hypothetical protein